MKRTMLVLTLMLVPTGAAFAQLGGSRVAAQVPFDFVLGDKALPAGELTVQSATMSGGVLLIQSGGGKVSLFSVPQMDETKKPAGACAMIFHRYNNRYFLSEIKVEGSRIAYRLPESKAEAELQAQNITATDEIRLASLK